MAVALAALAQGVQILRVHDTQHTAQAIALWQAVTGGNLGGNFGGTFGRDFAGDVG